MEYVLVREPNKKKRKWKNNNNNNNRNNKFQMSSLMIYNELLLHRLIHMHFYCLLNICYKENTFATELKELMKMVRKEQLPTMGFPQNWQNEDLFNLK